MLRIIALNFSLYELLVNRNFPTDVLCFFAAQKLPIRLKGLEAVLNNCLSLCCLDNA